MRKKLFVANFEDRVDEEDLERLFSRYGKVVDAKVWLDLETLKAKGFGFVEMQDEYGAERAIENLNGSWWRNRRLRVSFARARQR